MPELVLVNSGALGLPEIFCDFPQSYAVIGPPINDNPGSAAALSPIQFGMTFIAKMNQVLAPVEFTNLFNEYRLDGMSIEISMLCGPSYANNPLTQSASTLPDLYRRYDPNDAIMETSWSGLAQAGDAQHHSFAQGASVTYTGKPQAAITHYVGGIASGYGYSSSKDMWLDTTAPSSDIEHYHTKLWWRNYPSTANAIGLSFRIQPTLYFTMRRPR